MKKVLLYSVLVVVAGVFAWNITKVPGSSTTSAPSIEVATVESSSGESEEVTVGSPDGTMQILAKVVTQTGDTADYSFYVVDVQNNTQKLVFEKSVGANTTLSVPNNTWSPDNKYFFIKENNAGILSFYIFNSSGEAFSDKPYLDASEFFTAKITDLILHDITGWDSETLLHVFTTELNGTKGASYWIEIPGGAVYRLATR